MRAAGNGMKTFFAQFVKGMPYSELDIVKTNLPQITIKQYGLDCFIVNEPTQKDIDAARQGLAEAREAIISGKYDVIVLDEACIALYYKLFTVEELIDIIKLKQESAEIIITGRYAPQELIDIADLVTEMKEIKHYYTSGVQARKGIEF